MNIVRSLLGQWGQEEAKIGEQQDSTFADGLDMQAILRCSQTCQHTAPKTPKKKLALRVNKREEHRQMHGRALALKQEQRVKKQEPQCDSALSYVGVGIGSATN